MLTRTLQRIRERPKVREWAEHWNGIPAAQDNADGTRSIGFNFPGHQFGEPIEWENFFNKFFADDMSLYIEPKNASRYHMLAVEEPDMSAIEIGHAKAEQVSTRDLLEDVHHGS